MKKEVIGWIGKMSSAQDSLHVWDGKIHLTKCVC